MTISEAAGKVADAMKGNPTCLAAILLAALFSTLSFLTMRHNEDLRVQTLTEVIDRCMQPNHRGTPE